MELRFEGYSDDTFGEYAIFNKEHDNCANGKPIIFKVFNEKDSVLVFGQFCPGTAFGWMIGVSRGEDNDEETPMPNWSICYAEGKWPLSPALIMDVPPDCNIELVKQGS